ncbi:hypothetical protein CR513_09265, partial [Mucuna pruriens]
MKAQIGLMMQLLQSMEARMHQDDIAPRSTRNTIIYPYGMRPHFEEPYSDTTQTPKVSLENPRARNHARPSNPTQSQTPTAFLEDHLKAIKGIEKYNFKALDLCLVPDVTIPHKFKVLNFDKYKGNSCPKNHLISYCLKMATHTKDDKLLIHFF